MDTLIFEYDQETGNTGYRLYRDEKPIRFSKVFDASQPVTQDIKFESNTVSQIMVISDAGDMPAPRKNRPNRNELKVGVLDSITGYYRHLPLYRARKATSSRSIAGKLGWQASPLKDMLPQERLEMNATYQRLNPSIPEKLMCSILDELGVDYDTQVTATYDGRWFLVDFVIDGNLLLEVGRYRCDFCHDSDTRMERDKFLRGQWEKKHGNGSTLFISSKAVKTHADKVKNRVKSFVKVKVVC